MAKKLNTHPQNTEMVHEAVNVSLQRRKALEVLAKAKKQDALKVKYGAKWRKSTIGPRAYRLVPARLANE
ncbi:MAG: hypothetical protein AAF717_00185 [Bacteroidota bacterium]